MVPDRAGLLRAGLSLRSTVEGDLPFLRDLYATTRADEMAATPWPDDARATFLDGQFALQHRHFLKHHVAGDFWLILRGGRPVGRLYLDRTAPMWRLVDIALMPALHGNGMGTALVRWLQRTARLAHAEGIELHVLDTNPRAARLYARLGFAAALSSAPTHRRMAWRVPVS